MVFSLEWAFLGNDKHSVLLGSIFGGVGLCLLIGVPLLLILREYQYNAPLWLGVIFAIIVLSIGTYSLYKAGCKRLEREN